MSTYTRGEKRVSAHALLELDDAQHARPTHQSRGGRGRSRRRGRPPVPAWIRPCSYSAAQTGRGSAQKESATCPAGPPAARECRPRPWQAQGRRKRRGCLYGEKGGGDAVTERRPTHGAQWVWSRPTKPQSHVLLQGLLGVLLRIVDAVERNLARGSARRLSEVRSPTRRTRM